MFVLKLKAYDQRETVNRSDGAGDEWVTLCIFVSLDEHADALHLQF